MRTREIERRAAPFLTKGEYGEDVWRVRASYTSELTAPRWKAWVIGAFPTWAAAQRAADSYVEYGWWGESTGGTGLAYDAYVEYSRATGAHDEDEVF